jgi:hypothetical protein
MTSAPRIWKNALQSLKSSSLMGKDLLIGPSMLPPPNVAFGNQILATHRILSSFFIALGGILRALLAVMPACYITVTSTS